MQLNDPDVTSESAVHTALSEEEWTRIEAILGRSPNRTERAIYSELWSEHCSYKHSLKWLATLPQNEKYAEAGPAGQSSSFISLDADLAGMLCFSPIRHFTNTEKEAIVQSWSSGIYTRGARPVAMLTSLYAERPAEQLPADKLKEVVQATGYHINRLGIPRVGGSLFFHKGFSNKLVHCGLTIGVAEKSDLQTEPVNLTGSPVFLAGSFTQTDGLPKDLTKEAQAFSGPSSAGMASYQERILMEATLELIGSGAVWATAPLEAGGLASAATGLCMRYNTGISIYLDKLPNQSSDRSDIEPVLEESAVKVVLIGKQGEDQAMLDTFAKWDLQYVQIGVLTEGGNLTFLKEDETQAEIPIDSVFQFSGTPVYDSNTKKPEYFNSIRRFQLNQVSSPGDYRETAKKLFSSLNIVSRKWMDERYDNMVMINNVVSNTTSDASVIRIQNTGKRLALSVACNPMYVYADPYAGGMIAVAQAARKIICTGGTPSALALYLNFGDPEDPGQYFQFVNAIKGIGDACRKFDLKVLDSHVNFAGQTEAGQTPEEVFPTPVVGMMGMLESPKHRTSFHFQNEGDIIYMLGNSDNDLGSSEYLRTVCGIPFSPAPGFDLYEELELQKHVRKLIRKGLVLSAHAVAEGGLFCSLMESAVNGGLGFTIETVETFRRDCFLFGESQTRIVISLAPESEDDLQNYLINNNVSFTKLGEVFGSEAIVDDENYGSITGWKNIYEQTLTDILN